jgi:HAD superfamily hydrolase (TIGR01509 family)
MISPNGVKAIFFDLDGTLRFSNPAGRKVFIDYAATLGVPVTDETLAKTWRWEHRYWASSDELKADIAQFPEDSSFWSNYGRRQLLEMGCPDNEAEMLAPVINLYMGENYRPENCMDPSTPDLLASLRDAGFILAVVSNREKPFEEELVKLGLGSYFQFTVTASDAKSWKPDPGIFRFALDKANVLAAETVYVGDNYFADVIGARNAGLKPVLLDTDGVFANPDCHSIKSLTELPDILNNH